MTLGVSKTREGLLDLKVADQAILVDVLQFDAARARAWLDSGAWGTAVVTLELSADGIVWQAASPAVTFSANGNSRELDVRTWAMLRLRVSTADAAAGVVSAVALLKTADVPTAVAAHAAAHLPDGIDAIAWSATIHGSGTLAARPAAAAANAGCLYVATDDDGGTLYRSSGSAWTQVAKGVSETATPAAHAATHQSGGSDAIKLDDLAAPDDNTDLNVSASAHGLAPKLPNDATKYLDGTGAFTVPPSGGTTHVLLRKAADESVTSSTTLQNDDTFAITFAAGETWVFEIVMFVTGDTAGDISLAFTGTVAGLTGQFGIIGPAAGAAFDTAAPESAAAPDVEMIGASGLTTARSCGLAGSGTGVTIMVLGSFTSPANGGTLTLQWAQRASSATATTVKANSFLVAHKV